MSAGIFAYNQGTAASSYDDLGVVMSGVDASLTDLGGYIAAAKAHWEGDEMDVYAGIQSSWDIAAAAARDILGSVRTALGTTTESVISMRRQVTSALQQ